jgi:hypothetical protein
VNLLIHGHPGSRLGFVAAVLTDKLSDNLFDAGGLVHRDFRKLHQFSSEILSSFSKIKICIHTTFDMLDRHFFLFFQKNVLKIEPEKFQNLHMTHREIIEKVYYAYNADWGPDSAVTVSDLYDYNINFEQTFDVEFMSGLYFQINKKLPSNRLIEAMQTTNLANSQPIALNHGCRVAAEIIRFEHQHNFTERDRSWSLNEACAFTNLGECLDPGNLYNNVMSKLSVDFYQGPISL